MVEKILEGHNDTLRAYGETGSGKTFPFSGARDDLDLEQQGLHPWTIGYHIQQTQFGFGHEKHKLQREESINYLGLSGTLKLVEHCQP